MEVGLNAWYTMYDWSTRYWAGWRTRRAGVQVFWRPMPIGSFTPMTGMLLGGTPGSTMSYTITVNPFGVPMPTFFSVVAGILAYQNGAVSARYYY